MQTHVAWPQKFFVWRTTHREIRQVKEENKKDNDSSSNNNSTNTNSYDNRETANKSKLIISILLNADDKPIN